MSHHPICFISCSNQHSLQLKLSRITVLFQCGKAVVDEQTAQVHVLEGWWSTGLRPVGVLLTGVALSSRVPHALLHTAVLKQGHDETPRLACELEQLGGVELAGHDRVLHGRALILMLHLRDDALASQTHLLLMEANGTI